MKKRLELIKSILLTVLVIASLMLTFGLWNDSPSYDRLYKPSYSSEVSVGGQELKKQQLIDPYQIIFHNDGTIRSFGDPRNAKDFYDDMTFWALHNFSTGEAKHKRTNDREIEVIYPAPVPMKLLSSLFVMDDDVFLPAWSYKKIFLTFDSASSSIQVKFISADGAYQATATINDSNQYKKLSSYFSSSRTGLVDYMTFKKSIYIPAVPLTVKQLSLGAQTIDERKFVKALFKNLSTVSLNTSESYYVDGQRGLRILQEKRSMEYINTIQTNREAMDPTDLIEKSSENINDHKGWTADYNLFEIDTQTNTIRYKMYWNGYEIFNSNGLATIEQQWRNDQLYRYRRPLFSLSNSLASDPITLPSGKDIVNALKYHSDYEQAEIEDIRIGYKLDYPISDAHSVTLEPAWFMKYKGNWQEIKISKFQGKEGKS